MKVIYIKDEDKALITNVGTSRRVNGKPVTESWDRDWVICQGYPKTLERKRSAGSINKRFELKDPALASDKYPLSVPEDEAIVEYGDWDEDNSYTDYFEPIAFMYDFKRDTAEDGWEFEEFEITETITLDTLETRGGFRYPTKDSGVRLIGDYYSKNLINGLHKMLYPEVLYHCLPLKLSRKDTYDLIREHIKRNINWDHAVITSDYDFCFTVEKSIYLGDYKKEILKRNGRGYKIPRYRVVQRRETAVCFEMASKSYQSYPVVEPFEGENEKDLKAKIDTYLETLMKKINTPLTVCDCCEGKGYVEK